MDGLVQQLGETIVDANWFHDWADLADSIPGHHRVVWLRVRADNAEESAVGSGIAVCHQSRDEPYLHAHSIWDEEPAAGGVGHLDCLGHDHLDDGGHLEALPLDCCCADTVFRLGLNGDCVAVEHYVDELGKLIT